ncbi:MAG: crossover junction endodeoxyribonuclease RuvC [Verrucomicrobiota bacterium]
MRILGIDPSIRSTGYGIIDCQNPQKPKALVFGTIPNPVKTPQSLALAKIMESLDAIIQTHAPDQAAIEKIIYVQSIRTAITMGSARGAALAVVGKHQIPVSEYPAKTIKSAATGKGSAQKEQVAFMMRVLFALDSNPQSDEADALAIALTHARRMPPQTSK